MQDRRVTGRIVPVVEAARRPLPLAAHYRHKGKPRSIVQASPPCQPATVIGGVSGLARRGDLAGAIDGGPDWPASGSSLGALEALPVGFG